LSSAVPTFQLYHGIKKCKGSGSDALGGYSPENIPENEEAPPSAPTFLKYEERTARKKVPTN